MSLKVISNAVDAALAFISRGWAVVPVPRGTKSPVILAWQKLRVQAADVLARFRKEDNVGLILGDASGGLVDVDLDAPEAVAVGLAFLPATGLVHGRPGKPDSHRWYRVAPPAPSTEQFEDPDGKMLVELRSNGGQTIVPPSVHPEGDVLIWTADADPADIDAADLRQRVAAIAACACLARSWPAQGSRHKAALAAAGLLLRGAVDTLLAESIVTQAARAAGDPEWQDRARAVNDTAAQLAAGNAVTGGPTLASLLIHDGDKVVAKITTWLNLRSTGSPQSSRTPRDRRSRRRSGCGDAPSR